MLSIAAIYCSYHMAMQTLYCRLHLRRNLGMDLPLFQVTDAHHVHRTHQLEAFLDVYVQPIFTC